MEREIAHIRYEEKKLFSHSTEKTNSNLVEYMIEHPGMKIFVSNIRNSYLGKYEYDTN